MNIVKTLGKAVPDIRQGNAENLFPRFEVNREQTGGYWFPSNATADETLSFSTSSVRIRVNITYTNYDESPAVR